MAVELPRNRHEHIYLVEIDESMRPQAEPFVAIEYEFEEPNPYSEIEPKFEPQAEPFVAAQAEPFVNLKMSLNLYAKLNMLQPKLNHLNPKMSLHLNPKMSLFL
ncbi:hypothetical protein V6N13_050345 [Hibiscus sabdariffa]|uniref:Uncharacterized protein n=2 Tax=Hibiscus sabdariffa TaxID=183260 RepID=A0ABR2AGT2_9ROSI